MPDLRSRLRMLGVDLQAPEWLLSICAEQQVRVSKSDREGRINAITRSIPSVLY